MRHPRRARGPTRRRGGPPPDLGRRREAFRDHWDAASGPRRTSSWFAIPELDTCLWRVAWDGDEVAGSVMNVICPRRTRGSACARLARAHQRPPAVAPARARVGADRGLAPGLRERDMTEAALGVDAENLSGALRVYESLGFRRHQTGVSYRKAIHRRLSAVHAAGPSGRCRGTADHRVDVMADAGPTADPPLASARRLRRGPPCRVGRGRSVGSPNVARYPSAAAGCHGPSRRTTSGTSGSTRLPGPRPTRTP